MSSIYPISRFFKQTLFLGFGVSVLISCESVQEQELVASQVEALYSDPVERDWEDIKGDGVIRMITRYSSGSYFLDHGIQAGFEYEMVQNFARIHGLAVEVVIPAPNQSAIELLQLGKGDLIADNYTVNSERAKWVQFSKPYNIVDQVLVVSSELGFVPKQINEIVGIPITIQQNSSYYPVLKRLQEMGWDLVIDEIEEEQSTESILMDVANGYVLATVTDDHILQASQRYMNGLVQGPILTRDDPIAWAVRKNAPELEAQINGYLSRHMWTDEQGNPRRSEFLNVLRKKYFQGSRPIADYFKPLNNQANLGALSPYDSLMQEVGAEYGLDWVMLTAIAAQESKFDPQVVSWAGAVGIMQVIPRFSEHSSDSLLIPEVNIREGARILSEHIEHYAYMDSLESWSFALATYNAGMGHVADARRIAMDRNTNPNNWLDVSQAFLKLMDPTFYEQARYGYARGIETVQYVQNILNRYNTYQAILALSQQVNDEPRGILGFNSLGGNR
ncbi:MAG: lytic transglycosylase F [Bacteroidetes bacterium]|nr:lytic transglycosylase F [Bacteroidota bacterium]